MPNYKYKCTECDHEDVRNFKISSDPSVKLICPECAFDKNGHRRKDGTMTRRIGKPSFPNVVGKVWAGDWFKKTYGHDIGEGAQKAVDTRAQFEREKRRLKADGIDLKHKSRQVDGKDRISIKKKDD